jgi:hypothetical protein
MKKKMKTVKIVIIDLIWLKLLKIISKQDE